MLRLLSGLCVLLLACGDDDAGVVMDAGGDVIETPDGGPACSEWLFAPGTGDLSTWPNPDMLTEDASTATGFRLRATREDFPELADYENYERLFTEQLSELDGFGVHAPGYVSFGRAFDDAMIRALREGSVAHAGFVAMPTGGPDAVVPAALSLTDVDRTLMLTPQRPLPEAAWGALYATRALTEAAGGCLEPSAYLQAQLASPSAETTRAIDALVSAGVIASADELVALVVFPTQTITDVSLAVAEHVRGLPDADFRAGWRCMPEGSVRHCRATLRAHDYRDEDGAIRDATPTTQWDLEVHAYLPDDEGAGAPYPTALFGHGLTASATDHGAAFAEDAAMRGVATVAISAVLHPGHPTEPVPAVGGLEATLAFLAADLDERSFDALRARDHFRQSTYDKLHVVRMLQLGPDIDGDDTPDIDTARLAYVGVSLGGIMGSELLALTDAFEVAVLGMPGGRLTQLIIDPMGGFSLIRNGLIPPRWSPGREDRAFPVIQTLLDRGDPAGYARHVLRDRFVGEPPSVIASVVVDDGIVTNASTFALARAMELPLMPPMIDDAPGIELLPSAPVAGNLEGGGTAAMQQFDRIEDPEDGTTTATHANFSFSAVAYEAWFHFLFTHWEDGTAEAIDPYDALGL